MEKTRQSSTVAFNEKEIRILDAVIAVLARGGIAAVSMRAIAKEADIALGLTTYYFDDKTSLIAAALRRIGEQDAWLVAPKPGEAPVDQLRHALRRVADDEFLRPDYLGLRLQLWSLASADQQFAEINQQAQLCYREGLAALIAAACPDLTPAEVARRAADILVIQNGIWLTSILIVDRDSIERSIERCEHIAMAASPTS